MGERVRHDVTLRPTLQPVVANCRGRLHGGLDVASFEKLPLWSAWRAPGPGKAVGLQLGANLQLIGRGVIHSLLHLLYPGQDSEQILHVVANLVRVGTFTANAEMSAIGRYCCKKNFRIPTRNINSINQSVAQD